MLKVCEIFKSIQGESSFAGEICSFIRLTGCNLSCAYCHTGYARQEGEYREIGAIVAEVESHRTRFVEITGGEPLLQAETPLLCEKLLAAGMTVLVETNGSLDISALPEPVVRIMDVKCPSSGMANSLHMNNLKELTGNDQCKLVIADRDDFSWATAFLGTHRLFGRVPVIFSPAFGILPPRLLADWILQAGLPIRLGLQLHKFIWDPQQRGV